MPRLRVGSLHVHQAMGPCARTTLESADRKFCRRRRLQACHDDRAAAGRRRPAREASGRGAGCRERGGLAVAPDHTRAEFHAPATVRTTGQRGVAAGQSRDLGLTCVMVKPAFPVLGSVFVFPFPFPFLRSVLRTFHVRGPSSAASGRRSRALAREMHLVPACPGPPAGDAARYSSSSSGLSSHCRLHVREPAPLSPAGVRVLGSRP
jgi:hypothetical protein